MLTILCLMGLWALWRTCDACCPWFRRLGDWGQTLVIYVGIHVALLVGWQLLSMATPHPPLRVQQGPEALQEGASPDREDPWRAQMRAQQEAQCRMDALRARENDPGLPPPDYVLVHNRNVHIWDDVLTAAGCEVSLSGTQ